MTEETVTWKGASGGEYRYWVHPIGTMFKNDPGNYAFAKRNGVGSATPIYFGEAESLKKRLNDSVHERLECARRNGANVVCAHLTAGDRQVRLDEEADLRARWDPVCNRQ
jgi:hypothetical protein